MFLEVKIAETAMAIAGGADEIDIVLNVGNYLDGDWEEVSDEISEQKCNLSRRASESYSGKPVC